MSRDHLLPVAICVPVCNEEAVLPGHLTALAQLDLGGADAVVCFWLDRCVDRSEAIIRAAAPALPCPVRFAKGADGTDANAGRARRAAMAMGLAEIGSRPGAILLSTDADSEPRRDWVEAGSRALALSDFVAGRLLRIDGARDAAQTRVEAYYDRLHAYRRAVDPVPWEPAVGHHQGGGANLGFKAGAYQAIGGFRAIPAGEDATLLDDAGRAGFRVRRDPEMVVATSSRRCGRASGGLADALRGIDRGGLPQVDHPARAAWQSRMHALARWAFERLDDATTRQRLGDALGLSADHVLGVGRDCPNGEAFAMRIVPSPPGSERLVLLPDAEEALATLERPLVVWAA